MISDTDSTRVLVANRIDCVLRTPGLANLMAAYFDPASSFAGDTFNTLGSNPASSVTRDDLLAVSLLDTPIRPNAVRGLLGPDHKTLCRKLRGIGPDVDIWHPDA